ncbi:MAG: hypothetical protein KKE12_18905 [Proteobacteria bacterium]|nr:hypothetical protein [Pseudomonadota bacterium]
MLSNITRQLKLYTSPWMTIGVSLILMGVVIFLGIMNYNREKSFMIKLLSEKGTALIRSFEVGERTGMMGMMLSTKVHLQTHIEETALLPVLTEDVMACLCRQTKEVSF